MRALLLAGVLILVTSCVSFRYPVPRNEKQATLIFPMDYVDNAPGTFFADYLFYAYRTDIGSSLPFSIDISTKDRFNVYRLLPPTTNEIRKIVEKDRETGESGKATKYEDIDFELVGGKINIFPYMVRVELYRSPIPGEGRKPAQRVYFDTLRPNEYTKILGELDDMGIDTTKVVLATIPGAGSN